MGSEEGEEEEEDEEEEEEEEEPEGDSGDANVSNDEPAPPRLLVNLGYGHHWSSEKPRIVQLSTERGTKGNPLIKLAMNRDDQTTEKMDSIILNMTQWLRLAKADPMLERLMYSVRETGNVALNSDAYKLLGYGSYVFVDHKSSKKVQIKKKFLPFHLMENVDFTEKENCDKIYDYLFNSRNGVSLNAWEYEKLRLFFNPEKMRKYIPNIDSFSPDCKCQTMSEERKKRCQLCRYFTFNTQK